MSVKSQAAAPGRGKWPEIALIGPYPPPYGGISVHIERLAEHLAAAGVDSAVYTNSPGSAGRPGVLAVRGAEHWWMLRFGLRHRCRIVHLLSTSWPTRLALAMVACCRKGKYVISVHGNSIAQALQARGPVRALLTRWLMRRMDMVIACNPDIEREFIERLHLGREKVRMIPGFIPPPAAGADALPAAAREHAAVRSPLISAVGWIGKTHDGCDLYGMDMMIELIDRLRKDHPDIGLIVSVNGGPDDAVRRTVEQARRRVGEGMFFITEDLGNLAAVYRASELFIRPTNTDGDAVSVREALHFGVPVVASDCVPRPDRCVLFRTRDADDFEGKVREALSGLERLRRVIPAAAGANNAARIADVYEELLNE